MMKTKRKFSYSLLKAAVRSSLYLLLCVGLVSIGNSKEPSAEKEPFKLYKIKHQQVKLLVGKEGAGQRLVDVSVSYPLDEGQFPLIVFSHGHALDNQSYYNLTDYWVARGYVVVAPMHLDSGGDLKATSKVTEKFGSDWIAASRLIELKSVINEIKRISESLVGFTGTVLTDKVIAAGHSYGALSSQQLSGAKVELTNNSIYPVPDHLLDDRVVAVVAISPPGLMKGHLSDVTWAEYSTPQLVVTGPNDFFPFIWPNYEEHFVSYLTAKEGDNYLLVLDEMDHYLGNLIGRLERESPPQVLALKDLSEISFTFIESYLTQSKQSNKKLNDYETVSKRQGVLRYERR